MKRNKLLFVFLILICLTGCSSKEKNNKEYYDLNGKIIDSYNYSNNTGKNLSYVIAKIKDDSSESIGLFYKDDDGYILLGNLDNASDSSNEYRFYKNKLYWIGNTKSAEIFEIELNENTLKNRKLNLSIKDSDSAIVGPMTISNVDSISITLKAYTFINEHSVQKEFNCNLETELCEF